MTARKQGRPRYDPTAKERVQVRTMSGLGIRTGEIAAVLGVSEPTLRKYYESELALGLVQATTSVAQSLFRMATHKEKPSAAAAIFWLKCRAGWRERDPQPEEPVGELPAQKLGKKDQAAADAVTAGRGTGWDDLLPRGGMPLQ